MSKGYNCRVNTYHLTEEAENFIKKHQMRYGDTMGIPCDITYHQLYYPEKKTRKAWLEDNNVDLYWVEYLFRPIPSINDLYVMRTYFKTENELMAFENWITKYRTSVDQLYHQYKSNSQIHVEMNVNGDKYVYNKEFENYDKMSEYSDLIEDDYDYVDEADSSKMSLIISPDIEQLSDEEY